jgi:hypothetical protein
MARGRSRCTGGLINGSAVPPGPRSRLVVVALCSAAIIVDGYDLIVHGTVVPPWSARLPSGSSVRSAPTRTSDLRRQVRRVETLNRGRVGAGSRAGVRPDRELSTRAPAVCGTCRALEPATGQIFYRFRDRERRHDFLGFLRQLSTRFPPGRLEPYAAWPSACLPRPSMLGEHHLRERPSCAGGGRTPSRTLARRPPSCCGQVTTAVWMSVISLSPGSMSWRGACSPAASTP